MRKATYKTSLGFPIQQNETICIRNGAGRVVERWTAWAIEDGSKSKRVTFMQDGYSPASAM